MDATTDWQAWHDAYEQADSPLSRRLQVVQAHIRNWLDRTAPDPVAVLSVCAGDGRDLLGVLESRSDADRVVATLVESDPRNANRADEAVLRLGLEHINVVRADAGTTDAYAAATRADLVLLCGVFGNISDGDVHRVVRALPQLCRSGATVIWTRHRGAPDLTPQIRRWFDAENFAEVAFVAPTDVLFSVGVHRFDAETQPLASGARLFTFLR